MMVGCFDLFKKKTLQVIRYSLTTIITWDAFTKL